LALSIGQAPGRFTAVFSGETGTLFETRAQPRMAMPPGDLRVGGGDRLACLRERSCAKMAG